MLTTSPADPVPMQISFRTSLFFALVEACFLVQGREVYNYRYANEVMSDVII